MTKQIREKLFYDGKEWQILPSYPLDTYSEAHGLKWDTNFSGCWRGYFGSWEVLNGNLFLVELYGNLLRDSFTRDEEVYEYVELENLFPGQTKVLADWFTGILKVPFGPVIADSVHQHMLFLKFKEGRLIDKCEIYDCYLLIFELADCNVDEFVFGSKLWQDECYMKIKRQEFVESKERSSRFTSELEKKYDGVIRF